MAISSPRLSGIDKGDGNAGLQASEGFAASSKRTSASYAYSATVLAWTTVTAAIAWLFDQYCPDEYVDEVFHVRQTQRFCTGKFEYDPMITTFPGVYIVGVAWSLALRLISWGPALLSGTTPLPMAVACGTAALRTVNLLFGAACLPLFYTMHRRLHADTATRASLAMVTTCALLPPLFFLQFLFYTDMVSVVFVMTMHLAVLCRRYVLAAFVAAAAVAVRQNNAVWSGFSLGVAVLQECQLVEPVSKDVLRHVTAVLTSAWQLRQRLLRRLGPLAAVPATFLVFLLANGGVVVGDHSMHTPVLHLAHPLHFVLFAAVALAPATCSPSRCKQAAKQLAAHPSLSIAGLCLASAGLILVMDRFTFIHYYILTTGFRHYRNWLVRKVLLDHWRRRLLVPAYLACGWALWDMLQSQSQLWRCAFAACTAVVLVPAALLEFRYFLIPFVMLALHMQPMSSRQLALTAASYAVVNVVTIYLFLFKPFHLADGSTARLIW